MALMIKPIVEPAFATVACRNALASFTSRNESRGFAGYGPVTCIWRQPAGPSVAFTTEVPFVQ
jgi:hypothetical protein